MKADVVTKDCWILGQLAGIMMLEQELTDAFNTPGALTREDFRRQLAQLNSWVTFVDDALAAPVRSARGSNGTACGRKTRRASNCN